MGIQPSCSTPHGGVWERLVRSCKKALTVVLQNQVLTDEVLLTAITEVESLVNSRPLTEVSSDADDLEALTPNHFLIGRATPNLPPGIFADKEISSQKRWRQAQVITTHIWKRWLHEYLPGLTARKKWFQAVPNLKVGDLVLIVDYGTPRGCWPLGRIVTVFPGSDIVVRSAEVQTNVPITAYDSLADYLVQARMNEKPGVEGQERGKKINNVEGGKVKFVIIWL